MAFQPTTNPTARPESAPVRSARGGPERVNWWNDRVFYEIFVRSFADSTSGPLAGDGIGDVPGLIERLDYLNDGNPATTTDLGIGGIWLMPIMPSPSYHGYDITDYYDINKQYGTLDDFRRLVSECHKRGIKVVIDLVLNHTSNQHEWFKDSLEPKSAHRDWYIWSNVDPGWKGPWNQRVWHAAPAAGPEAREGFYYGLFSHVMPDLNFRNAQVTDEVTQICRFWLANVGIDGFRLDAIRHLIEEGQVQENTPATHAWLRDWYIITKGFNIDAMSIGEVWADSAQASSYVGDQMSMVFEFALADAMIASVKAGNKTALVGAQDTVLKLYPPNQYGRFLSNHDQTRVMTQLKGDEGAMRAAASLLLTGPGVPFVYYGEEIGMTGDKPDEKLRTPMQWTGGAGAGFTTGKPWAAANAGFESLNVEKQSGEEGSLLNLYRGLIRVRNANPALATGTTWQVQTDRPEVVALLRRRAIKASPERGIQAAQNAVLTVINLSDAPIEGCSLSLETSPLRGELAARELLSGTPGAALVLDERGGFKGYRFEEKIEGRGGRGTWVIELK